VEGTAQHPSFVHCVSYEYQNCSYPFACSNYNDDCMSCVSLEECAWCDSENACVTVLDSSCDVRKSCPFVKPNCPVLASCEECTPTAGCVWCKNQCVNAATSQCSETSCSQKPGGFVFTSGWIALIVFAIILLTAGGFGSVVWYRFYWLKRHYYETLK